MLWLKRERERVRERCLIEFEMGIGRFNEGYFHIGSLILLAIYKAKGIPKEADSLWLVMKRGG